MNSFISKSRMPSVSRKAAQEAYPVESKVSGPNFKLGDRPFVGAAPKVYPLRRPMTILGCSLCQLYPSRVEQALMFWRQLGFHQTIASSGKSINLILSSKIRKRTDRLGHAFRSPPAILAFYLTKKDLEPASQPSHCNSPLCS